MCIVVCLAGVTDREDERLDISFDALLVSVVKNDIACVSLLTVNENGLSVCDRLVHKEIVPGLVLVIGSKDRVVLTCADHLLVELKACVSAAVERAVVLEAGVGSVGYEGAVRRMIEIIHHVLVDGEVVGLHSGAHSRNKSDRVNERDDADECYDSDRCDNDSRKHPRGHSRSLLIIF